MTDFVEINGESFVVEAWKYTVHNDGAGLEKYPVVQYKDADRDQIERQIGERDDLEVSDFEALVSAEDVKRKVPRDN